MKVVAVVPMKLNNRRLPQKNTKTFSNGVPLCRVILSTLLETPSVDEVYVFCSDDAIKQFIPDRAKYLKRSPDLDLDTTTMNDVLSSFCDLVQADVYVLAHATAPFISKNTIETGISAIKKHNYDSAFAAKKLQDFLWKDGKPINYDLNRIPRTQDLEPLYMETCGLYIYKRDVMTLMNRRIGNNPFIIEVGEIEAIDIDEKEDFEIADSVYMQHFVNKF